VFVIGNENQSPDILEDIEAHQDESKSLEKTERESIVKSRIGQGLFRDRVVELWGSCSVTGLGNLSLLRASHIKPWRDSTNQERLDPMNGLLLQPTLDHLFDLGLISFDETGAVLFSPQLSSR
jgi:putative restriction endonuclease